MSVDAQVIIAIGFAGLLLMFGVLCVIWSIRCDAKKPHYRLPALLGLSFPLLISAIWMLTKIGF